MLKLYSEIRILKYLTKPGEQEFKIIETNITYIVLISSYWITMKYNSRFVRYLDVSG